jgi:hypothetical protein
LDLVSYKLRAFISCAGLIVSLTACAELPVNKFPSDQSQDAAATAKISNSSASVLTPMQSITGGRIVLQLDANGFPTPGSTQGYAALISPTSIAVRGTDLYIADSGARKLYRYYSSLQAMSVVADVTAMPWIRMQIGVDQSLYVLDAASSSIKHFTRSGHLLQTLTYPLITSRLTEFVLDDMRGKIIASDQLNNRLVILHLLGNASRIVESSAAHAFTPMAGLALSVNKVYALDVGCECIVVLDEEGRELEHIGKGLLKQASALAVDHNGLIFVADSISRSLKIFLRGSQIADYKFQSLGVTEISALAVDDELLYISDSAGAKILVFHINLPI